MKVYLGHACMVDAANEIPNATLLMSVIMAHVQYSTVPRIRELFPSSSSSSSFSSPGTFLISLQLVINVLSYKCTCKEKGTHLKINIYIYVCRICMVKGKG
jgi:hypothetical protein